MNMGYIIAKHYNAHMLSYIPHMKSSCKIFLLAVLVILSVSASDEIPGRVEDVADSISRNALGAVYEMTVRVTYPPHPDGRFFAVADETGALAIRRRFDWPAKDELKRGDLIQLRCEIGSTATYPVSACFREASVLARDEKLASTNLPSEEEVLEMLFPKPSWWTNTRIAITFSAIGGLFLLILTWNMSLRHLVDRRSRELLREKVAHVSSELKIGERTRLAVELHDSVAQNLAGVSLQIDAALRNLHVDRDKMIHNLSLASTILKTSREELRNCLWDLRNHALDEQDLNTAIRQTLKPIVDNVNVSINFDIPRNKLSDNTAHAVLRIIRELVANSIRHGKAKNIIIEGKRQQNGIVFSVADDGCGFDEKVVLGPSDGHFGLAGIRERLNALSGKMSIERTIDKCTKITVTLT